MVKPLRGGSFKGRKSYAPDSAYGLLMSSGSVPKRPAAATVRRGKLINTEKKKKDSVIMEASEESKSEA